MDIKRIYELVAREHSVSVEEVRCEIERALGYAQKDGNSELTAEGFIEYVMQSLSRRNGELQ